MPMNAASSTFTRVRLEPLYEPPEALELPIGLEPGTMFVAGQLLELATAADDVQTITPPESGDYTLTFTNPLTGLSGTTVAIAFDADDAATQAAIRTVVAATGGGTATVSSLACTFTGTLAQRFIPLLVYAGTTGGSVAHTTLGGTGAYRAYTTGPAKAILPYACATDVAGNITLGAAATGGSWGETSRSIGAYFAGVFTAAKVIGLDDDAVADLGRLLSGTVTTGVLVVAGP